jgi:hypothetical protein
LHFRAHAEIPAMSLRELVGGIAGAPRREPVMPQGTVRLEGVGSAEYYYALATLTAALDPQVVVEVGTYLGVGTLTLALNTGPATRIITIDLPGVGVPETMSPGSDDHELVQRSRGRIGEAFSAHPAGIKIQQILGNSLSLTFCDFGAKADLVFIDGGHSRDVVKSDTENALMILADDGAIVWDDYWWLYPDVVAFLNELGHRLPLLRIEETNLVVYCRGRMGLRLPPRGAVAGAEADRCG